MHELNRLAYEYSIAVLSQCRNLTHPNIVHYIGTYEANGEKYLVTELMHCSLKDLLIREGKSITILDLTQM